MNEQILKVSDFEEVKMVVISLKQKKCLGTDGFNGCFLQKCWSIIGSDFDGRSTEVIMEVIKKLS